MISAATAARHTRDMHKRAADSAAARKQDEPATITFGSKFSIWPMPGQLSLFDYVRETTR